MLVVYTPSTKDPTPEAFSFGAEAASNLSNNLAKFGPSTSVWLVPETELRLSLFLQASCHSALSRTEASQ